MNEEKIDALKSFADDLYFAKHKERSKQLREAIAELRSHKEQVRCGGCEWCQGYRLVGKCMHGGLWCIRLKKAVDAHWYCADAKAAL